MPTTATATAPAPRISRQAVETLGSTTTRVAWIPDGDLELADWTRAGQRLGVLIRCSPWWLGDWIRYGNTKFGEKYSRASVITGYDPQTLMNMVYVASRFDKISRRREILSWSHHEAVASLDPETQDRWLDEAIEHKMSVADLRLELRSSQRGRGDRPEGDANDADQREGVSVSCPHCGRPVPRSLFESREGSTANDPAGEHRQQISDTLGAQARGSA
jgi:hypothetical protein